MATSVSRRVAISMTRWSALRCNNGGSSLAVVDRVGLESSSSICFSGSGFRHHSRTDFRQISQLVKSNGKRAFLVDTLALVRRLEAQGIPSKQAEAITAAITEVLNDSLENSAQTFVSRSEMQKIEMTQDSNLSKFKSEVKASQEHHFSVLQRETEKLRTDIERMRSELRYEIDKVTAGQRLDLNLERGRIRDELANQNAETSNLTNKLDREIHSLRAQLEAAKYDVIKYCIGTLVSISAVGLAIIRILM
ncbi:protein FMP32, mitochondrial-like [Magnolia sinica]|uniref:protein FMP32, mitochondrial-like n=1 Tax=Magnolia sinica TaxID=86752 RepID=UPI00265A9576|nr:protein FMP32, mitochondrial-like [Magnolia sinica]